MPTIKPVVIECWARRDETGPFVTTARKTYQKWDYMSEPLQRRIADAAAKGLRAGDPLRRARITVEFLED